jgi:hypothetical protein
MQDLFSPYPAQPTRIEDTNVFFVDGALLHEAMAWVSGCENCTAHAVISFDYILDGATGADPTSTEYLLFRPAMCPECQGHITEKTRVSVG